MTQPDSHQPASNETDAPDVPLARPASPPPLDYGIDGPVEWVTVARAATEFEANLIRLKLEADGIRAGSPNTNAFGLHPAFALSGLRVLVQRADAERAVELLRDTPAGRRTAEPQAKPRSLRAWARVAAVCAFVVGVGMVLTHRDAKVGGGVGLAGLLAAMALRPRG